MLWNQAISYYDYNIIIVIFQEWLLPSLLTLDDQETYGTF